MYEPAKNPSNPNNVMKISLAMVTLLIPESQKVAISMRGGNISASIELLTEPTNEITALRFGIAAAKRTKKTKGKKI